MMIRKNALLLSMILIILCLGLGCSVNPAPTVHADTTATLEVTPSSHKDAHSIVVSTDNSYDQAALSDFHATEAAGQDAIWRDFEMKSSAIGIEKDGITLKEFGVAYNDILMVAFHSSEPIAADARPNIVIDTPLPATVLEEEYCKQESDGYLTVYSVVMDRKIPYLNGGHYESLVQIELIGRDYVFRYNWDWRQPAFAENDAELGEWLIEAASIRTAFQDDAAHILTPAVMEQTDPFRVVLEQVSMRKNLLVAEGFVEVLHDIEDEYWLDFCLEANGELFSAGVDNFGFTRLGDNRDSTIISSGKSRYQIGWQWEMPFYYEDILNDQIIIRIELTNRSTSAKLHYNFPYCLS